MGQTKQQKTQHALQTQIIRTMTYTVIFVLGLICSVSMLCVLCTKSMQPIHLSVLWCCSSGPGCKEVHLACKKKGYQVGHFLL